MAFNDNTKILWTRCKACGTQLYLKRLQGKRPQFCDSCREIQQKKWKEKINGNSTEK